MTDYPTDNELSRLLRENDPLALDPELTPAERIAIRRTVMAEVPSQTAGRWHILSPAFSVTALLAIALTVAWWPRDFEESTRQPAMGTDSAKTVSSPASGTTRSGAGNSLENRTIRFETPGGTLVVWVLNPNFPS